MPAPALIPLLVAGTEIASSIFSFTAAAKAREKETRAQIAAAKAMAEARKKLEVNYFKGLSLSREAYDLEFEKMAVFGTSALQAGTEGDQRGVGAVVGRVGQMIAEQAKQQRVDMAKEMTAFKVAVAKEETNLQKMRTSLDLGEAIGAQKAAQDAGAEARYNTQQGLQQAVKGVSGVIESGIFDPDEPLPIPPPPKDKPPPPDDGKDYTWDENSKKWVKTPPSTNEEEDIYHLTQRGMQMGDYGKGLYAWDRAMFNDPWRGVTG